MIFHRAEIVEFIQTLFFLLIEKWSCSGFDFWDRVFISLFLHWISTFFLIASLSDHFPTPVLFQACTPEPDSDRFKCLRLFEGSIPSFSRYLATVRRAMSMLSVCSRLAIFASL